MYEASFVISDWLYWRNQVCGRCGEEVVKLARAKRVILGRDKGNSIHCRVHLRINAKHAQKADAHATQKLSKS